MLDVLNADRQGHLTQDEMKRAMVRLGQGASVQDPISMRIIWRQLRAKTESVRPPYQ